MGKVRGHSLFITEWKVRSVAEQIRTFLDTPVYLLLKTLWKHNYFCYSCFLRDIYGWQLETFLILWNFYSCFCNSMERQKMCGITVNYIWIKLYTVTFFLCIPQTLWITLWARNTRIFQFYSNNWVGFSLFKQKCAILYHSKRCMTLTPRSCIE